MQETGAGGNLGWGPPVGAALRLSEGAFKMTFPCFK